MKPIPAQLKVEELSENWHGYKDWNTFTIRDAKTNVCVAVVGEVDRYFETEYASIARLIAAAPELLEALQGYLRMSDTFTDINNPSREEVEKLQTALKFVAPAIRAAIAKATGE